TTDYIIMYDFVLQLGIIGPALLIAVGMAILFLGGETLLQGASRLAVAAKIPPIVVGLTIVAFITSTPELAISISATMEGKPDIAVGNIVGSNICNIALILGVAAVLSPIPIAVCSTLIRREIPLMIAVSGLVFLLAVLGSGTREHGILFPWMGALMFIMLIGFTAWTVFEVRRHRTENEVYAHDLEEEVLPDAENSYAKVSGWKNIGINLALIAVGLAMLVAGADMMVQGSVKIAQMMEVSELIIALTILAIGTSLPELMISTMAALKGKSDIAVGNIVGTNIFNILGVLGIATIFSGGNAVGGLLVSKRVLHFDMPVMILMTLFCIVICFTGRRITRGEGIFLLICYAAYLAALCVLDGYSTPS
ncbi:MAG: calcium/sodium antiporter, partial [Planctomycetaceae bacterium]|nr:calcium/sodium antiporter [Planctomycetaceae bacterium]